MNLIQEKLARLAEERKLTRREKIAFLDGCTQMLLAIKRGENMAGLAQQVIAELQKVK